MIKILLQIAVFFALMAAIIMGTRYAEVRLDAYRCDKLAICPEALCPSEQ